MNVLGRTSSPWAVLPLAVLLVLTVGCRADDDHPVWRVVDGDLRGFEVSNLVPGDRGATRFTVTNSHGRHVTFSLLATHLATDDRGCNEPEREYGDRTCSLGGGELHQQLVLTLTALDGRAGSAVVYSGSLAGWVTRPVADRVRLPRRSTRTYRIEYELPVSATNLVQSDHTSFRFEMRLQATHS